MNNQRGGIISKLIALPIGIVLMAGFFFLGYYVGKYQSKSNPERSALPQLPEVISKNLPKQEDFTFYKTLTDKENKTVSIDLKPKPAGEEIKPVKKETGTVPRHDKPAQPKPEKKAEIRKAETKPEKPQVQQPKETALKPRDIQAKKDSAPAAPANAKLRYTIQIAAYPDKDMAEEEVKKMKKHGYAAFIVASDLTDKGTWYRVRLGSFTNKAAAEKLAKELRSKEGLSPFITIE